MVRAVRPALRLFRLDSGLQAGDLQEREVHVWIGSLRRPVLNWDALAALLDPAESIRAAGQPSAPARRAFVAARGQLRLLLARYLGSEPAQVGLDRTAGGRPFLPGSPLSFNLSHSGGTVIYAFSRAGEVGADVQSSRPGLDWRGLAARFFAPDEALRLGATASGRGRAEFYRLWTEKEAMAKADGGSLFSWLTRDLSSARRPPVWWLWSWSLGGSTASVAVRTGRATC